jgi:hypothetical protein
VSSKSIVKLIIGKGHQLSDYKIRAHNAYDQSRDDHDADHKKQKIEPEYIEQVVKNMEGNDYLASQDDVATAGEWMCYRSTVTDLMIPFLSDALIEETPLDDHTILYLLRKVGAKRGKKIEAKVIDQDLGYGFRRYWNTHLTEEECTKTACGYPHGEFVKELNILHRYGIV